jgi:hypothetical protein
MSLAYCKGRTLWHRQKCCVCARLRPCRKCCALKRGRSASPSPQLPSGMNRLLSFFKRRLSRPTSSSFFSTNTPRLAQALQPDMPQTLHPSSSETFGNFDLINRVKVGFSEVTVSSWFSRVTGLNVVHLDYEGERFTPASHPFPYVYLFCQ